MAGVVGHRCTALTCFILGASLVLFIPQVWKQQAIKHSISFLEQLEIQVAPVTSAPAPLQAQAAQVTQALAPIASAPVPDTPAAVTPATNPPDRPVASAGLFAGVIPLVYVWFCGEVMLVEQGKVAWNITKPCVIQPYFTLAVSASLLHVPVVVLLTDPVAGSALKEKLPADLAAKLHVHSFLDYVDDKFWTIRKLYEDNIKVAHGFKEPFEKWNVLNFFVFRRWLEKEQVPAAGFAEGDVVVMVPPFLPRGCQGEISWRDRWDKNRPWGPFTYCALASMGNVLSLDIMNDWTDFNIELYKDHFWIQRAISRFSFVHAINQMHTWYFYAMGSLDFEGMPWSDGEPWYLQYIRRPSNWTREKHWMVKYDGKELPYPNATLPTTKRYRLCNGYFPRDGYVIDSAHGYSPTATVSSMLEGTVTTTLNGSRMTAKIGNVTYKNYHFQGQAKNVINNIFKASFQAHGGFKR
ncbi:unnamed protein product [Symbiodinium natans]|uniref:Uncharacterized protein n=1 Tax=Symbiodinium natans TaxID=878477 RepID=A0A812SIS9_9DINO|nr:unnamed protein product [Symbiodinium natans]